MCGKFAAGHMTQKQMAEIIEGFVYPTKPKVDTDAPQAVMGDNIRPTNQVPCVTAPGGALTLSSARWWFVPEWQKGDVKDWKATTFNARIEEARNKPTFRGAWRSRRCLMPAQAYYEWSGPKGRKVPWIINPVTNADCFFFAGLYSTLGTGLNTCTMLTRAADSQLQDIHARMPVILRDSQCRDWLDGNCDDDEVIESYGTGWTFDATRIGDEPKADEVQGSLF